MSAQTLSGALVEAGTPCAVEGRDGLAVVRPRDLAAACEFLRVEGRAALTTMARTHGFTHVAVELVSDAGDVASLPGR
jgi:hypothetical protein